MSDVELIRAENATYTVSELCDALDVAPSSYYAARNRKPSARARQDKELVPRLKHLFVDSRKTYGSPRIHRELVEAGVSVGRHRVARLMKENGLTARQKPKYRHCTTNSNHNRGYADNLLQRDFVTQSPNRVWVGDVTYIATGQGWSYLAAFVDLYARRVVGWFMANHKRDELSVEALRRAFAMRNTDPGLIVHSDRGSEFASRDFRSKLKSHAAIQSMSRKGDCYDNAVAESFFASLEKDLLLRRYFKSHHEANVAVTDYIQNFYNPIRRHSYNDMVSPEQAETEYSQATTDLAA